MTQCRQLLAASAVAPALFAACAAGVTVPVSEQATANPVVHADQPFPVEFPATRARLVRLAIHRSSSGQPCVDELEVYGPGGETNLALASSGARALASSCLPGYAIHQVLHLNDGQYGNERSWIAAGAGEEWAQIELPAVRPVSKVVISRDRKGRYADRVPIAFSVMLSVDGAQWQTVRKVVAVPARQPRGPRYSGPFKLSASPSWDELLTYAFNCERHTWTKLSADDHLSPLKVDRPASPGGDPYWGRIARMGPLERTLAQMEDMVERLGARGLDVAAARVRLGELRRQAGSADADDLYHAARLAKRRLMLRDPDLAGIRRTLFVKRHPYHASHNYSDVLDSEFRPGGGVCVLEIPWRGGQLRPRDASLTTLFDASSGIARDAVTDADADRVFFAYRPDGNPKAGWKPYWHLMALNTDGTGLRQLTDGPYHDYYPCPLPDGGLTFISTRCKARFLCWRPQAFVLFRVDADGSGIRPLSFANLSEWSPRMMRDGRILWTRSEYIDKGADFGHTLWAIRPDGTHPELVFGNNTPNCYINACEVPGTREILCTLFSHGGDHNGPIGLIDRAKGPFDTAAITSITPDIKPHYNMSWPRYECFRDPTPVSRDTFLVAHAPGERFGLYLIDRYGNRELLYMDPAIGSMSPTPLRPSECPPVLAGQDVDPIDRTTARLTVLDLYQGLSPHVARGRVKYLRVCQEVRAELIQLENGQYQDDHQPFQDWYATPVHKVSGPHGWPSYVAKASLGIVPVAPDGSASFRVPAGKVLYLQALDEDFNELQRMRSVMQLQPGEHRSCIGCHENRQTVPPAKPTLAVRSAPHALQAPPWGAMPFSYERVVQPVWDAHCVKCHNASHKRRMDLTGTLDREKVPASYRTLIAGGWVHYFNWRYSLRHSKAEPLSFGTLKSKLWRVLDAGHNKVRLNENEKRAVKCWIDLNCPLWPDYQFRSRRPETARANGAGDAPPS